MKPINLFIACFIVLNCTAQTFSESLADAVVATEKGIITGLLKKEENLRKDQRDLLKDIRKLEDEYSDKRTPFANNATIAVVAAIEYSFSDTRKRIESMQNHFDKFKFISLGLYGLGGIKDQLKKEREYLNKLEKEKETLRSGLLFSGSAGDNYTVYLKLLIKIIPVKNAVMAIEKEIKTRILITRILEKQL